jgi:PAS domain S-box-containing protein
MNDLTQNQSAQKLRESDAQFRSIFQEASVGIVQCGLDQHFVHANRQFCKIVGYTEDELRSRTFSAITHPDDVPQQESQFRALLAGEIPALSLEKRYIRKDGAVVWANVTSSMIRDSAGQPVCTTAVIEDITHRKNVERQLLLQSSALEAAANGIVITDRHGVILWVNPAFTQLTGYSAGDAIGKQPNILKSGQHDSDYYRDLWATVKSGRVWHGETINRRKDGSLYTEEQTITPVRGLRGEITHFISIKLDVTERRQVEHALRKSEQQYRSLVETAQDVIVTLSVNGTITSLNPAFEMHTGWPARDWLGKSFATLIHAEDLPLAMTIFQRTLHGEHPPVFELRVISRDKGDLVAQFSATPHLHGGQVVEVLCIARNITDRKRVEQELHESEELFRSLSTSSPLGILTTDIAGRCNYTNPRCRALLNASLPQCFDDGWLERLHLDDRDRVRSEWQACVRDGREYSGEFRIPLGSTNDRWIYLRSSKLVSTDTAELKGYVATLEDITDRHQSEATLRETNRRLEQVLAELRTAQNQIVQQERLRALGTMASGIAHDFNNALAAILGFSELLLHRPDYLADQEKAHRYLQMMNTAAKDAGSVVNRLREFYRTRDEGEIFSPIQINQLIEQAISLTQPKWASEAQATGSTIEIATDLQKVPAVLGNASELREVLTNLIFNAVDAMPDGGRLTLATHTDNNQVVLTVSDTGIGMTEDVREHCLEPFFSTKGTRGSGLGLSMVFGIIQRHNGHIEIDSQVGRGTTFSICLPLATALEFHPDVEPTAQHLPALRILLVDDEEMVRSILADLLASEGHLVETASDGMDGLNKFQHGKFDVTLIDRAMPAMSGDQLARAIKSINPATPVILLTGFGSMMNSVGEKPPGVDFVVGKPVTLAELRQSLAKAVTHS